MAILSEMGHIFQLSTVRMLAWFVAKLLRNLYQGLLINKDGMPNVLSLDSAKVPPHKYLFFVILQLKKAMSEGPVLILPSHRSYADNLLVSYLCFSKNMPLPVIATGMGKFMLIAFNDFTDKSTVIL